MKTIEKNHVNEIELKEKKENRGRKRNETIPAKGQVVHRSGRNLINPNDIFVDWDNKSLGANPRVLFGKNKEDWDLFKQSIIDRGVEQSVKIFISNDGRWHLRHGFRRMKAVQEINSNVENTGIGQKIELIPFDEVSDNEEEGLIDHFDLNNSKSLTDIEAAEGLYKLRKLTGETNIAELSRRVHLPYNKTANLLHFAEKASTKIKRAILDGVLSFSVAKNIINVANSSSEQIKLLKEGEQNTKNIGKFKIRTHSMSKVKEFNLTLDKKILDIINEAKKLNDVDKDFIFRLNDIIISISEGKSTNEILDLFKKQVLIID